jgi:hypothetical protein
VDFLEGPLLAGEHDAFFSPYRRMLLAVRALRPRPSINAQPLTE